MCAGSSREFYLPLFSLSSSLTLHLIRRLAGALGLVESHESALLWSAHSEALSSSELLFSKFRGCSLRVSSALRLTSPSLSLRIPRRGPSLTSCPTITFIEFWKSDRTPIHLLSTFPFTPLFLLLHHSLHLNIPHLRLDGAQLHSHRRRGKGMSGGVQ